MVLAALEPAPAAPPALDVAEVAKLVAVARNVPPDQLLDLAIAKLRAVLPPGTEIAPAKPFNFLRVPVRQPAKHP
jgi:hypothetical protein